MRRDLRSMRFWIGSLLACGALILGLTSLGAAPDGESQPPKISRVTPVSFFAEWAAWPKADITTHYQIRLGNALYGASTRETWMEVKPLTPGKTYRVAVATYHRGTIADVSSAAIVLLAAPTPLLVSAWGIGSTSVTISWGPVSTAVEYRVFVDEAQVALVPASTTRVLLSGFRPGQKLSVTVVAINEAGPSNPSKPLLVSLNPASPVLRLEASEIGQTDVTLRWQALEGAASYTVSLGSGTPVVVGSGTLARQFTGLTPGASYTARVSAISQAGGVSQPGELVVQMIPPTPLLPQALSITNSSFLLEWAPCRGAERYKVYYAGEYMLANVPASVTRTLCRPFGPGETASMTVVASNLSGDSPQSPVLAVTLTGTPTRRLEQMRIPASPAVGAMLPVGEAMSPSPLVRELANPDDGRPRLLLFPDRSDRRTIRRFQAIRDFGDREGLRILVVEPRMRNSAVLPTVIDPEERLRTWLLGNSGEGFCFLDEHGRLRSWGGGINREELETALYRSFPDFAEKKHLSGTENERTRFQSLHEVE